MGMDHNLDLLTYGPYKQTQLFFEDLLDKNILPTITHPTHITQSTATLINNIFVSEKLHNNLESAVILKDISDHLPTLALLKQTKLLDNNPIEFESPNLLVIKNNLLKVDWTRHLSTGNSSENFDLFLSKINKIMDSVSLVKMIRISVKRKYLEPWMTSSLEISVRCKLKLYKKSIKLTATDADRMKYKVYRSNYNKSK